MKIKWLFLVILFIGLFMAIGQFPVRAATDTTKEEVMEYGNVICPVTGDKINSDTKATYDYEGVRYNFCCPGCIDIFKQDPIKCITKFEDGNK